MGPGSAALRALSGMTNEKSYIAYTCHPPVKPDHDRERIAQKSGGESRPYSIDFTGMTPARALSSS